MFTKFHMVNAMCVTNRLCNVCIVDVQLGTYKNFRKFLSVEVVPLLVSNNQGQDSRNYIVICHDSKTQ